MGIVLFKEFLIYHYHTVNHESPRTYMWSLTGIGWLHDSMPRKQNLAYKKHTRAQGKQPIQHADL